MKKPREQFRIGTALSANDEQVYELEVRCRLFARFNKPAFMQLYATFKTKEEAEDAVKFLSQDDLVYDKKGNIIS